MKTAKRFADSVRVPIQRLLTRLRYPFSLPEEVLDALGLEVSKTLSFPEFMDLLTSSNCKVVNLKRFMPRDKAEDLFKLAMKKERFRDESLFSFYFSETWIEFILHFDKQSRLRRLYLQHKDLKNDAGIEIFLSSLPIPENENIQEFPKNITFQ